MILAPVVFILIYSLTAKLGSEGRTLSAILGAVAIMWVTEIIPLPVSALLGAVLCVLLGVADAKTVLAYFADPIVFVFIGGFMIARAMMIHGLDRRIALGFLSIPWIGSSQIRIMAGLGLVTAVISMWVSNSAVTAMMFPIALGILGALQAARAKAGVASASIDVKEWPYATAMMLMVAYAASIGGIGTPVGTPPNLIGIGLIKNATGVEISFFRWMSLALPLFVVMALFLFLLLYLLHLPQKRTKKEESKHKPDSGNQGSIKPDNGINDQLRVYIKNELKSLGPWTRGQINTLIGFGTAVVFWVLPGILQLPWFDSPLLVKWMNAHLPESIVAIGAAILLFAMPVDGSRDQFTLNWKEAVKIDWGTILLFGGGLALGSLMFKTGVAKEMGYGMVGLLGVKTLWAITGLSIAMAIILSEAASNTASANMIIPVVIAIAQAAGVSPLPPALGACLGASFGFMLPVSTPPNAIVYGSGLIPLPKMIQAGILFDIMGFFIIWAGLYILCPLLGLT
jgi:solute carrier family 13 (sodium-dependent dicarboxylate transporter), member 2/3/5